MDLSGKVSFITGGARGIGFEIASLFAKHGSDIVIGDVNGENLRKAVDQLKGFGIDAEGYILDVSNYESCEEVVKKAIDKYGHVDILVNNAGITRDNLIMRMKIEDFDKVISINLKGVFNCTKALIRYMMKQRSGRIINISSVIGLMGNAGQANYAASKAGVIGLTKSTAKEVASRNINVNAIAPGYIQTEMTEVLPDDVKQKMLGGIPLSRPGTPTDVANAALFLASDYSSYITGQVIVVDGGMVM
ncbi:MAG: beta-ketoacyl-ACP reductase [Spirochaetes bacterium]|nr:MAG: beta-ketoacyl-ACP reductase [Spirochaetota bacterium]